MGRKKRDYPHGTFRLRVPKNADRTKEYPISLEYTWNRKIIRKTTNIKVRITDWNPKGNSGKGEIRSSFGTEYRRLNTILNNMLTKYDLDFAEYYEKHPNSISVDVVNNILCNIPLTRSDNAEDFKVFAENRLKSEYNLNKIGYSRYKNGLSAMKKFREFLISTCNGTYREDSIYVGDISVKLLEDYIEWRRNVIDNKDVTINQALTPILKACQYASDAGMIGRALNAKIQDTRISVKASINNNEGEKEFDGKYLSEEELKALKQFYLNDCETRRKEFIEMFFFAYYAAGLRMIDVMTLKWQHINIEKKELRKIMVKTQNRHTIPLNDNAIAILNKWKAKRAQSVFVFDLVNDNINLDNNESLYLARNNANKCINQALRIVGEKINLPFGLTFHIARHTFAVHALNQGLNMSVVSRLLGHGSTDITEHVYAQFLPETLASEMNTLDFVQL